MKESFVKRARVILGKKKLHFTILS